jgi:NlpC/P60 family
MSAPPPRHLRARSRRLSTPLRWLLSLALLIPLVAGLAGATGVTKTPTAVAVPGSSAAVAVRFALAQLGKPYRWGAEGPRSFDCSGLVQTVYRAAGIHLPRVSRQQYGAGKLVPLTHLRAGDLLFYAKTPLTSGPSTTSACTWERAGRSRCPTGGRRSGSPPPGARDCSAKPPGRPAASAGCCRSSPASAARRWPPSSSGWPPTAAA